jgi:hypothetical protein
MNILHSGAVSGETRSRPSPLAAKFSRDIP